MNVYLFTDLWSVTVSYRRVKLISHRSEGYLLAFGTDEKPPWKVEHNPQLL